MHAFKYIALLSLLLLGCFFPASSFAAEPPLRIVVSGPYPPFAEIDEENGSIYGFDVDIAQAVCKELKRECEISNMDFDLIIPALMDGTIDLAVAGMGVNEERKKQVDFTDRYYRSVSIFIEYGNKYREITPDTIKGLRVAAQSKSLQADYLAKTYGKSIKLVTATDYDELFDMLKAGKVDIFFSDGLPGYTYLTSEKGENFETIGAPIDPGDEVNWSRITLPKQQDKLREAINKAIQNIRRTGEYDKINRKYFDFTIY